MMFLSRELRLFCFFSAFFSVFIPTAAWDSDLELFDLVEEIPQTFYEFLSVGQDASSAEIKKAYRRLSLILHPDKNKDDNAEIQFRQLVAIYEILKDEERRQRYNDILINGLPDWRQPVFYYRRVRKMSNMELAFLLFLILTVGHYAVIWSIYLEKQLDELLTKKKKEKKKKINSKSTEELKCAVQEKSDRAQDKPHWQDILPLKLSIWIYLSIKYLPYTIQDVKQYYEDYKLKKMKEREEAEAMAEQEAAYREKKPKVKKSKLEFPVFEPSMADGIYQTYESASIDEIEEQMDDWLENKKLNKKKVLEWTDDDLSLLSRSMVKFPGGTPGRWEKIAHDLGRSVADVTAKVKQVKDNVSNTSGLVKLSDLKGSPVPWRAGPADVLMTQREPLEDGAAELIRRRSKKTSEDGGEVRIKGRRQRDFDPMTVEKEVEERQKIPVQQDLKEKSGPADSVWTQNQQKLLELALQQYPRGTTERWDRIAKIVPGKNKEECMIRYKLLAELVQKRKQTKI